MAVVNDVAGKFYAAYIHPSAPLGTSNHVYSHSKQIFCVCIPCEGSIQNCPKAHIFSDTAILCHQELQKM